MADKPEVVRYKKIIAHIKTIAVNQGYEDILQYIKHVQRHEPVNE